MTLPADFAPLPLDPSGGLPVAAALPAPDGDLRAIVVAAAEDLAALLSAPPDRLVWTSADHLRRRSEEETPGSTLSGAAIRVTVLVVSGRRVLAAVPPRPGRPLAVADAGRMRGHLYVDEVTVTAGALVAAGPTGARLSIGWRTLTPPRATTPVGEVDPYAGLV